MKKDRPTSRSFFVRSEMKRRLNSNLFYVARWRFLFILLGKDAFVFKLQTKRGGQYEEIRKDQSSPWQQLPLSLALFLLQDARPAEAPAAAPVIPAAVLMVPAPVAVLIRGPTGQVPEQIRAVLWAQEQMDYWNRYEWHHRRFYWNRYRWQYGHRGYNWWHKWVRLVLM